LGLIKGIAGEEFCLREISEVWPIDYLKEFV